MPVNFLDLRQKIKAIGAKEPARRKQLDEQREQVRQLLASQAGEIEQLRRKVEQAVEADPFMRCAKPVKDRLDAAYDPPALPEQATLLAADGSQINPDRHTQVNFYLINVGTIAMQLGAERAPEQDIHTELFYGDELYTEGGTVSKALVELRRDERERTILAELAAEAEAKPVIALTDGPLELWGSRAQSAEESARFINSLDKYKKALADLQATGAAAAGYVDKPRADYVVQLLEVAAAHANDLAKLRKQRPYRGVTDTDLYSSSLGPGQRSGVFAIQSRSAHLYAGPLGLHFFYLNVGSERRPWLARVEIPAWVAEDEEMLGALHAVLLQQCGLMGERAYPYLLHRAHEIAVVKLAEKEQIGEMLAQELRQRGVPLGQESHKQAAKNLGERRRFEL